jgi:predicted nucleotidyltransferase
VEELARFAQLVAEKLAGRVLLVSVFGSRVKGRAGPLSDVDVAVPRLRAASTRGCCWRATSQL